MEPVQSEWWASFYEGAWAIRAQIIQQMIEEGERHPYRLIKRLEAQERRKRLQRTDAGGFAWAPRALEGEALLPCGTPAFRKCSLRGDFVTVSYHTTPNLHNVIVDYIAETGPYDAVVELGCGYGRNIFEMWYQGAPARMRYYGGEYTDSGVAIARELAALEPALDATFFHCDHTAPDFSSIPRLPRALVFTMHSIEQVKVISPSWFEEAASIADEVVGLNFEPFGFQFGDLGQASRLHRAAAEKRDWNQNFGHALLAARNAGLITLDTIMQEVFIGAEDNPTSLAIWRAKDVPRRVR